MKDTPFLSGLIAHLLAVPEGSAEPLNDNIEDWKNDGPPPEIIS